MNTLKYGIILVSAFVFGESICKHVMVEISLGELVDKITILEIKKTHITDPHKQDHICTELAILTQAYQACIDETPYLQEFMQRLREANQIIWNNEDAIRAKEQHKEFDAEFITFARTIYHTNDERSRIKRIINEHYGSSIVEEKLYTPYTPTL